MQKEKNLKQENKKESQQKSREGFTLPPRPQPASNQTMDKGEGQTTKNKKMAKEKSLKTKEQKQQFTPQQKAFIKKWGIITLTALVAVVGIIIAIILIVDSSRQNARLIISQEGMQLSVIETQNEKYLFAPNQPQAEVYFFEIKNILEQEKNAIEIEWNESMIDIKELHLSAGTYQVRFAIQKRNKPSTKSKFSEWVTVIVKQKLETPDFKYDSTSKQFYWKEISNANAYKLFYFQSEELKNIVINEFEVDENEMIKVSLNDLKFPLGMYEFTLIAINAEADHFIASDYNEKVKVKNFEKLQAVESVEYSIEEGKLSVMLKEFEDNLKLKISYGENQNIKINIVENSLFHTFDLKKYNGLTFDATDIGLVKVSLVSGNDFVWESDMKDVSIVN